MNRQTEPPGGANPASGADPADSTEPASSSAPAGMPGARPARPSGSMTDAPPWIGGATIGALFLSAAVLITYTLLPLPGQRSLGDVNYLVAALLFGGHITFSRLYRSGLARRAMPGGAVAARPHSGGPDGHATTRAIQSIGPVPPDPGRE
ncbi:hypothetical protein [Parafrankia sp. EUN1f]|uniref:hypothetical protein n=1 Tax=Parafrankia sp. EUN1f TaxID=102897 RepID=UPI001E3B03BF|nr:hypothetical protein [Parafrankia sp. EUN1f]